MVALPPVTPVTIPVDEPTVAIAVLLLAHVPPPASLRVVVLPAHTVATPVIAPGSGLTVTVVIRMQPVGNVYVIGALPADIPVTILLTDPIVAIPVAPLLHVPPRVALLSVVVLPSHTDVVPDIVDGKEFTVSDPVLWQPVLVSL